jgi:hypothetical protein
MRMHSAIPINISGLIPDMFQGIGYSISLSNYIKALVKTHEAKACTITCTTLL